MDKIICKPIYEFVLWDNCSNNCKFCYQKQHYKFLNLLHKKDSCKLVKQFLLSDKYINGNHILLVGGEIFDDQLIKNEFLDLCKVVIQKMNNQEIDLFYINTNLIYKNTDMLFDFLDLIEEHKLFNRLKFTTSYDISGRFSTKEHENIMISNLRNIKHRYNNINIVVNVILTKPCCEEILKNNFNIFDFQNKYDVKINLIPYIDFNSNLAASKTLIFKTLNKLNNDNSQFLFEFIREMDIKQPRKLYVYENNELKYSSCKLSTCGHSINFKKYNKDNHCFVCDLKTLFLNTI